MKNRLIDLTAPRSRSRRSLRIRPVVAKLDVRQLMATGVTGLALNPFGGIVGSPLPVYIYDPSSLDLPASTAPVGTPVPLVVLTSSTGPLSASGYSATVDWGDGSPVDAASFSTYNAGGSLPALVFGLQPGMTVFVNGPDHTYQAAGSYAITVSVTGPGDSAPTVYHDTTTIATPPIEIVGQLNPLSDSGVSNGDGNTNINTPNFFGVTQPGATVVLTAEETTNLDVGYLAVGSGVADASGFWSINTIPLYDGNYSVVATATGRLGGTATTVLTGVFSDLKIDTIGPKVVGFRVVDAKQGIFQVGFSDQYGLLTAPLTDPANYVVTRPSPTPRKGQKFPVATLISSTVPFGPTPLASTYYPDLVTATVGTGKPLITRNGTYTFTVRSSGITSLAGTPLDGEYTGKFPAGNGLPGGDFQVRINVKNGKASAPIVIKPVKVITHTVRARAAVQHHH